ncbi:MAG TPA: NUDIX hydrolase [Steroidobacteraceae bacterium]|nr:NUDIX hydrolase [Steroidobacteraceae bacterium]
MNAAGREVPELATILPLFQLNCRALCSPMSEPRWLTVSRELQAIAQTGLSFTKDAFDRQRFERVRELAATVMAEGAEESPELVTDLFRQEVGYPTPKVDVRGAAFVEGKILMVRERSDGRWTLPGGWADVNRSASECVIREIAEESGFESRVLKLAAVWDYSRQGHYPRHPASIYKMFFVCEITGGEPRPSIETTEIAFFGPTELPELSGGRVTAAQIAAMFEHAAHPLLPAAFD